MNATYRDNNGMMHMDATGNDIPDLVKALSALRRRAKSHGRGWYTAIITMKNGVVRMKGHETWLQIIDVAPTSPEAKAKHAFHDSGRMDISVKLFEETVAKSLAYVE